MGIETIAALGMAAMAANAIASSASEGSARDAQSGAIKGAAGQIGAYRPELASAMQQGTMNRSGAFQGANNVLASMYGSGGAGAPKGLTSNPMAQVFGQGVQPPQPQPGGLGAAMQPARYPGAPPTMSADPLTGRR